MKRIISILLVFSLLINISSCFSYKTLSTREEYSKYSANDKIDVLRVQTKKGTLIEFNKKYPGKISETGITGLPQCRLSFDKDSVVFNQGKIQSVWKNGTKYELINQDTHGYLCHTSDSMKIAFSEIDKLEFRKFSTGKTIGLFSGIFVGILTIVAIIEFASISSDLLSD